MQCDAVIFDLDGTLIETEEVWDGIRRGLAEAAGVPWPQEATRAMMGMSTAEWSTYLAEEVGLPGTPEQVAAQVVAEIKRHHEEGPKLLPGAIEAVRRMGQTYRVAIASSSPKSVIASAAVSLGIDDVVEVKVSTEEVQRGKPHPDGFLRAAELLGVEPARCVAVEDSSSGIKSALAAGMAVVSVPPAFEPPPADLLEQVQVLTTLDELTVQLIDSLSG